VAWKPSGRPPAHSCGAEEPLSLLGAACYFWLVFLSSWALFVIQLSAFAAVAAVFVIIVWIECTLTMTPLPMPLEDLSEGLDEESSRTGIGRKKRKRRRSSSYSL
jgi:hypothetical protein